MSETSLAAVAVVDPAVHAARSFVEHVFPAPRQFAIRLWDGTTLPSPRGAPFTLVIRAPGSLRRMFRPPVELSFGEGYLRRDFDIEGDLCAAFDLIRSARGALQSPAALARLGALWLALPRDRDAPGQLRTHAPARLRGEEHTPDRDRAAIRYHYDVGNSFYQLFLDRRMIYSCAYFPAGTEELDAAQEAKLELICRKLRLRAGERLLDIGCGWGGLLMYAAERHGVHGVGITLSAEQLELARERVAAAGLQDRVRIEHRDYREMGDERFDKIVSVGMFEHVGRRRMADYFAQVHRLLEPGGLFLNHSIASRPATYQARPPSLAGRALDRWVVGNFTFRKRYVFPDGELIPLSEANLEAERAGFEVRDVENLREHYALTLRHWMRRLRERREQAVAIAGEPVFRLWEMYLAGSAHHFETARININQTLFASPAGGDARMPMSRHDLYR